MSFPCCINDKSRSLGVGNQMLDSNHLMRLLYGNPRESLRSRRIRAALNDEYRYSLINSACQVPT